MEQIPKKSNPPENTITSEIKPQPKIIDLFQTLVHPWKLTGKKRGKETKPNTEDIKEIVKGGPGHGSTST